MMDHGMDDGSWNGWVIKDQEMDKRPRNGWRIMEWMKDQEIAEDSEKN